MAREAILLEHRPQLRRMELEPYLWSREPVATGAVQVTLAFPYVFHLMVLQDGRVDPQRVYLFFRNNSLMRNPRLLDQTLHPPCLTNVFPDCRVCTGDVEDAARLVANTGHLPRRSYLKLVGERLWQSRCTTHLASVFYGRAGAFEPRLATFKTWNRASQRDRDFILAVPWERLGSISVRQAAGEALGSSLMV